MKKGTSIIVHRKHSEKYGTFDKIYEFCYKSAEFE